MSSGLSMTSVNKIKELASAHEYSLAAPILDSQDLEQSYNPQFLRVCGEVYENVGRLREARRLYVKAHTLAPEATRIIFSLINFYLKKGYFDLADRYFEEYVHFSSGYGRELQNIKYIMKKAKSPDLEELYDIIYPYYRDNMDEYWSFELLCLSKLLDKGDMDIISTDYKATFKSSAYLHLIDDVLENKSTAWDNFFIYAENPAEDNDPEEEETRAVEQEQLEKDYYVMNPESREAVITEMVSAETKKKELEIKSIEDVEKGLKNFIKKKFKKKDKEETEEDEEKSAEDAEEGQAKDAESGEDGVDVANPTDAEEEKDSKQTDEKDSKKASEGESSDENTSEGEGSEESTTKDESSEGEEESTEESAEESEEEDEFQRDFVTYEFDDGFAPESDTIAGLSDIDSYDDEVEALRETNVFKEFAEYQAGIDSEPDIFVPEPEPEPEIEPLIPDIADEPEIETESDFDKTTMTQVDDSEIFIPDEPAIREDIEEIEIEETEPEVKPEPEPEPEVETEPEPIAEVEVEPETVPEFEEVSEPEPKPEIDPKPEPIAEVEEEPEPEPISEPEEEEEPEPQFEDISEPEVEAEIEPEPEPEPELITGVEEEPEALAEEEPVVEESVAEEEPMVEEPVAETEPVVEESVVEPEPELEPFVEPEPSYMKDDIPSIDFTKYSSDLFPHLGQEEYKTENKFADVVKTEGDKLDAGLMEEEAKLKEAEALLASLGIKI